MKAFVAILLFCTISAQAKTINLPKQSIEDVLVKAKRYVVKSKIDITGHFIGKVEYKNLHNEYKKPVWRVTWILKAGTKQGQIFIDVHEDGTIKRSPRD